MKFHSFITLSWQGFTSRAFSDEKVAEFLQMMDDVLTDKDNEVKESLVSSKMRALFVMVQY